ncbi:MAG: hypothetical protein WEE89_06455 [Gemmatimonadota bacterium]
MAGIVIAGGVLTMVLGMVLVVLGVMAGALFVPGVVLLIVGSLAVGASGVLYLLSGRRGDAR